MRPPASAAIPMLLACALLAAPARAQDPGARVEGYLESRNLDGVLAETLLARLETATSDERDRLVERAADLVATLIRESADAETQAYWESRARALIDRAGDADATALRLQLLRASYARAERVAERWRVRAATRSEVGAAVGVFTRLADEFEQIAVRADRRVEALETRAQAQTGDAGRAAADYLDEARRRRSLARYLSGWSNLYLAQLSDAPDRARAALEDFAWILGAAGRPVPDLHQVDPASLAYEHVARSAVGTALAHAELGDADAADDWLETALTSDEPPDPVRAQGPVWRLIADGALGRWGAVADRFADPEQAVEPTAARIAAVMAAERLRAGSPPPAAQETLRRAAATLLAQGRFADVVELSRRFGGLPLEGDGLLERCVDGLALYLDAESLLRARDADATRPATGPASRRNFATAAEALARAADAPDAERYPQVRAECLLALGMSRFYAAGDERRSEQLLDASRTLESAAEALAGRARSAETLWMALRAAQLAEDAGAARTIELAQRFVDRFPDHERAGSALLALADAPGVDAQRAVDLLLRVPPRSPAYNAARDQAARRLFAVFRRAEGDARTTAALRYADVAEPLVGADLAATADPSAQQRALARGRRLLDALLSIDEPRAARAQSLLSRIEHLVPDDASAPLRAELLYRRAQIARAQDDQALFDRAYEQLAALDGGGVADQYLESLSRWAFRQAAQAYRSAESASPTSQRTLEAARRVVSTGEPLLEALKREGRTARDAPVAAAMLAVADALATIWASDGDRESLERALDLRREVLETRPNDAEVLEAVATLAREAGDRRAALEAWSRLVTLREAGSAGWFEARTEQIELLAEIEPERAAHVLRRQHRVLYPDYGPSPWGERLRAVDQRLGEAEGGAP